MALKHKDSFGKSENLSKLFFAEILVYLIMIMKASHRAVMVCSESLLLKKIIYLNYFSNCSEGLRTNLYTLQLYFARCNYYQIVNLTSVQSVKVVQKYFG